MGVGKELIEEEFAQNQNCNPHRSKLHRWDLLVSKWIVDSPAWNPPSLFDLAPSGFANKCCPFGNEKRGSFFRTGAEPLDRLNEDRRPHARDRAELFIIYRPIKGKTWQMARGKHNWRVRGVNEKGQRKVEQLFVTNETNLLFQSLWRNKWKYKRTFPSFYFYSFQTGKLSTCRVFGTHGTFASRLSVVCQKSVVTSCLEMGTRRRSKWKEERTPSVQKL